MILSGVSFLAPFDIITQGVHGRQASSQQKGIPLRVASWNIESLFDTHHDSLRDNHKYLLDTIRHWSYSRYRRELADVARVITVIGEWDPSVLAGSCEIENDIVLRNLTRRSPLKELSYRYVITNSPNLGGIGVALLYQRDLSKPLPPRPISIPPSKQRHPTRDLPHVSGSLLTGGTLDILVCHSPGRSGGAKESGPYHLYVTHILHAEVDSIMNIRSHSRIIVMRGLNDYPANQPILETLKAEVPPVRTNDLASTTDSTNAPTVAPSSLKLYHLLV